MLVGTALLHADSAKESNLAGDKDAASGIFG
jgi:hypothetical protein